MPDFYGIDVDGLLRIKGKRGYGVSIAIARGDDIETFCSGSGRFGRDFPVNSEMLFQAGSVSKPMFALTLLRYVDKDASIWMRISRTCYRISWILH